MCREGRDERMRRCLQLMAANLRRPIWQASETDERCTSACMRTQRVTICEPMASMAKQLAMLCQLHDSKFLPPAQRWWDPTEALAIFNNRVQSYRYIHTTLTLTMALQWRCSFMLLNVGSISIALNKLNRCDH
jgi:hypothetical protein